MKACRTCVSLSSCLSSEKRSTSSFIAAGALIVLPHVKETYYALTGILLSFYQRLTEQLFHLGDVRLADPERGGEISLGDAPALPEVGKM